MSSEAEIRLEEVTAYADGLHAKLADASAKLEEAVEWLVSVTGRSRPDVNQTLAQRIRSKNHADS